MLALKMGKNIIVNKRGISEIVSTVLIILLTLIVAATIYSFVVPFVEKNLQSGSECIGYENYFKFVKEQNVNGVIYELNCESNGRQGVFVRSSGDLNLNKVNGFQLVFLKDNGLTNSVKVLNNSPIGKVKMFNSPSPFIELPPQGDSRTYVYQSGESYKSMKIYSILNSGRVCEANNDEISFAPCQKEVNLESAR